MQCGDLPEAMKKYRDYYFCKAKRENYPARSIYKLKEIARRFPVFKTGMRVLDLGAAPGSWSLGAAEMVGENGSVLGCDLVETATAFPQNVTFMREDVFNRSEAFDAAIRTRGPFDVVMSDMAPNTTGHRGTDQARSALLYEEALSLARSCLAPKGNFIVKVFMGPDVHPFMRDMRTSFATVRSFKPNSSRAESVETFYIGLDFKRD
ncbi:ribosomal RNA large subunit methyltransferase E [Deltaproteobacteria bacterium]|nr:ribosomal RNA large subunit methyltransferase E [Deltaproteobacteria bacterium]